jgi:2-furoyl-CoA dehydrogenase large subunit
MVADNDYRAEVSLGVGPVKGTFRASVTLSELDEPRSVTLSGGLDGPLGSTRGSGRVRLEASDGGTRVSYDYSVEITGKVAAVGGRMLEGASRVVVNQFFERLVRQVEGPQAGPATTAAAAPPSLWQRIKLWFAGG